MMGHTIVNVGAVICSPGAEHRLENGVIHPVHEREALRGVWVAVCRRRSVHLPRTSSVIMQSSQRTPVTYLEVEQLVSMSERIGVEGNAVDEGICASIKIDFNEPVKRWSVREKS